MRDIIRESLSKTSVVLCGSGRTYYRNDDLDVKSQLSTEILLQDLDELACAMLDEQDTLITVDNDQKSGINHY